MRLERDSNGQENSTGQTCRHDDLNEPRHRLESRALGRGSPKYACLFHHFKYVSAAQNMRGSCLLTPFRPVS